MSVYFIVNVNMKDAETYNKYLDECDPVFEKYNGKYLAVDNKYMQIEGESKYTKIILIEFKSENEFNEWYYSEEYQRILKYRLSGSDCDSILLHGKIE